MDSIKHLFRQVSGGDYLLIILMGIAVYFIAANLESRQRLQVTGLIVFLLFCFQVIFGISFIGSIGRLINKIGFIYLWAPLSLSIFITSMFYESGNLKTIVVRSIIASICICGSLYFIFG